MAQATEEKRQRILEAARKLLVQHGFQDLALDEVAREAGVAKGTLFLYYKSKDALFSSAFADLMDGLGLQLEAVHGSTDDGELLEKTVRTILEYFDQHHDFTSQFSSGRFPGCTGRSCDKLLGKMSDNLRRVSAIVVRCSKVRGFAVSDPEWAAMQLFSLCRSAFFFQKLTGRRLSLEARTEMVIGSFLNGVRAPS
jgi:AcrR family transcriptional regulator